MHRRLGLILLYGGAAVCALAALGFALGMTVTVSEAMAWKIVRAAAYLAPLLVGVALMGGGAWLVRAARTTRTASADPRTVETPAPRALAEARAHEAWQTPAAAPEPVAAERRPRDT